jgi:putative FmdB family regulatory protein
MPLYSFHCPKCNKIWELLIKLGDYDKEVECPTCKAVLKRMLSPVPFKFK